MSLTKEEKAELDRHRSNLSDAQAFFWELETKYEGAPDGPPTGPYGEAGEALANAADAIYRIKLKTE